MYSHRPLRSTSNSPAQRTPPRWASIRCISASRHPVSSGPQVADHRAQQVVAVAEHVGLDRHAVAHTPLDRVTAAVDRRRRVLDHDPPWRPAGRIGFVDAGCGCSRLCAHSPEGIRQRASGKHPPREQAVTMRAACSSTSPRCPAAGSVRGLPVRRLAGGRGAVLVAGAAARAARPHRARRTRPRSAFAAWRGLLARAARAACRVAEDARVPRSASAFWIGDWERFAGRRRGRRPGALRARVDRAARATRPSAACG